ncbi:DeoR/GlpR family DNA-binding transcription regulator [Streptomyces longwoodensis]|uniref:DeoR/GlpR family DNA-binding transcription regulator n=1 Tax=Streptomyces longwoodensis TaxID=68231 RepID=UPI0033C3D737
MLSAERHQLIANAVNQAGMISTKELIQHLGVSAETVRRDLTMMEERGLLTRVRGGAAAAGTLRGFAPEEAPYAERSSGGQTAKRVVAEIAAALLKPGMTIVIDVGTTAVHLAAAVPQDFQGLVATPSLLVAGELSSRPNMEVLVAGGRVRGGDQVCGGVQTVEFFASLNADISFIGSGGVDARAGVTDFYREEIAVKRQMMRHSQRQYILCDASKFGLIAPHQVCSLDEPTGLITDVAPDGELATALGSKGIEILHG